MRPMFLDFADFLIDPLSLLPTTSSLLIFSTLEVDTSDDLVVFSIEVSDTAIFIEALDELSIEICKSDENLNI